MSGSSAVKSSTASHVAAPAARYGIHAHPRGRSDTTLLGACAGSEGAVVCSAIRNGVLVFKMQSCFANPNVQL